MFQIFIKGNERNPSMKTLSRPVEQRLTRKSILVGQSRGKEEFLGL